MTENEKAVIIGCFLNGAKIEAIAHRLLYSIEEVKAVVEEYEKNNHKVKK